MAGKGVNKVLLVGHLGADPESRSTASGSSITSIRIATSESWKDKESGELQERTEWHRVKFFGRLAEIAAEYLRKGSQVYIEGSLRTDKYTDKDGIERYSTEVIANEMQMLGGRADNRGEGREEGRSERRADDRRPAPSQGAQRSSRDGYSNGGGQRDGYSNGGGQRGGYSNGGGQRGGYSNGGGRHASHNDDDIPF